MKCEKRFHLYIFITRCLSGADMNIPETVSERASEGMIIRVWELVKKIQNESVPDNKLYYANELREKFLSFLETAILAETDYHRAKYNRLKYPLAFEKCNHHVDLDVLPPTPILAKLIDKAQDLRGLNVDISLEETFFLNSLSLMAWDNRTLLRLLRLKKLSLLNLPILELYSSAQGVENESELLAIFKSNLEELKGYSKK